jgi:hypothetical protein
VQPTSLGIGIQNLLPKALCHCYARRTAIKQDDEINMLVSAQALLGIYNPNQNVMPQIRTALSGMESQAISLRNQYS